VNLSSPDDPVMSTLLVLASAWLATMRAVPPVLSTITSVGVPWSLTRSSVRSDALVAL